MRIDRVTSRVKYSECWTCSCEQFSSILNALLRVTREWIVSNSLASCGFITGWWGSILPCYRVELMFRSVPGLWFWLWVVPVGVLITGVELLPGSCSELLRPAHWASFTAWTLDIQLTFHNVWGPRCERERSSPHLRNNKWKQGHAYFVVEWIEWFVQKRYEIWEFPTSLWGRPHVYVARILLFRNHAISKVMEQFCTDKVRAPCTKVIHVLWDLKDFCKMEHYTYTYHIWTVGTAQSLPIMLLVDTLYRLGT